MPEPDTAVVHELWRRGNLRYMLRPAQLPVYDFVGRTDDMTVVSNMHRGSGKSFLKILLCFETALRGRHAKYVGPTAKMVRSIAFPHASTILSHCPAELRPKFRYVDGCYEFPSGGTVWLAGADTGHADTLRGTDTHFGAIDEFGFMADPDYVINEVLMPRVLTANGRLALSTTPPRSPSHPAARLIREARERGSLFTLSIYDNPDVTVEQRARYARECGGENTTAFRREFGCEVITEESAAVIPEAQGKDWVAEYSPKDPVPYESVALDPSGLSVYVAAVNIARRNDENTCCTTHYVYHEESAVNASPFEFVDQHVLGDRAVLTNLHPQECAELARRTGLPLVPRSREEPKLLAGTVRTMLRTGVLRVDPECSTVIRHLKDAVWNDQRTDFDASGDGGRFDAVSAVGRLLRSLPVSAGDVSASFRPPDAFGIASL